MKYSKLILSATLIFLTIHSFSQETGYVSGMVLSKNNQPIGFATLYSINQETSCITNEKGEFRLKADFGDTVRIQHLNYEIKEVEISGVKNIFTLTSKDFVLDEIMVSPQAAFDLFNIACKNTWTTFKDENLTHAYCKIVRQNGSKITQEIDLDLDVVQKKQNRFKRGEKILPFKVQERKEMDTANINESFKLTLNFFYPHIHEIYWIDLPENFNYYKIDDDENIKLYLRNKVLYDQKVNIEVTISLSDSLLQSFAMIKRDLVAVKEYVHENDTFYIEKTEHFIGYDYSAGFGVLSKYYQSMTMKDPSKPNNSLTISQNLKTTIKGDLVLDKRRGRRRIFRNSFDPVLVTDRYNNEFWDAEEDIKVPYNFHALSNMKLGVMHK